MIAYRGREGKRSKVAKMSKTLERLYKEGKCRDCSVVVTRMDFAKILGKFTKVKIQYATNSTGKTQKPTLTKKTETQSPLSNARLKKNENGIVNIQRTYGNRHLVKDLLNTKKQKSNKIATPPRQTNMNILKENNGLKFKTPIKDKNSNYDNKITSNGKQYTIIFNDPSSNITDIKSDLSLLDFLPNLDKTILPSEEWFIEYFPKTDEPKNDKVYDRIAAELEDLMYNEKPDIKSTKPDTNVNKSDEFPSIMDILNDNVTPENNPESKDQSSNIDFKGNLESSDVEAMLLGKSSDNKMDVDNADVNKLISDVVQFSSNSDTVKEAGEAMETENPHSPSILDEALQKGIEEHLPCNPLQDNSLENNSTVEKAINLEGQSDSNLGNSENNVCNKNSENSSNKPDLPNSLNIPSSLKLEDVKYVIFKKVVDGNCIKSVTCLKNLIYSIELEGKPIEFLGAPKYLSNLDDVKVLLEIVNETDLRSLYVLC